jgi:hypothetical protein
MAAVVCSQDVICSQHLSRQAETAAIRPIQCEWGVGGTSPASERRPTVKSRDNRAEQGQRVTVFGCTDRPAGPGSHPSRDRSGLDVSRRGPAQPISRPSRQTPATPMLRGVALRPVVAPLQRVAAILRVRVRPRRSAAPLARTRSHAGQDPQPPTIARRCYGRRLHAGFDP